MAIGERIKHFRILRGLTQRYLGVLIGFPEKSADIRMAQYETGTRTPKENTVNDLARILEISPAALDIPNIETQVGLMHTLFALEDIYGLKIGMINDEICLRLDKEKGISYLSLLEDLTSWQQIAQKLSDGEITKEEYDNWRYTFPKHRNTFGDPTSN